ncbi:unnamed protein product [Moneuplotes crassus]|uniref:Ubiquitin-like domain-containing protein n=1 Tax=Euplotes crassus TaxID=5936 RepID=A0AAD1UD57_EUPCR|nr:unnamed protein product [Moneuplotes crassus]
MEKEDLKATLEIEIPYSYIKDYNQGCSSGPQTSCVRYSTTLRTGSNETQLKKLKIEFINPDDNFPLIWDIKERVFLNFSIPVDSQLIYNGSGIQVTDTTPFNKCKEMLQPFRLKIATATVKLLVSVFSVKLDGLENSKHKTPTCSSLRISTYGSSSVYNLCKIIEKKFGLKEKNLVLYFLNKQLCRSKSLVEHGIYEEREEAYRIKAIEKAKGKGTKKISLALDPNFYKINSVRKNSFKSSAPWYCEAQNGLNWIAYCKNLDCYLYKQMVVCSRGYGTFSFSDEINIVCCPSCKKAKSLLIKNIGFVKCYYSINGLLNSSESSVCKLSDRTYDKKMHLFKEMDHKNVWINLTVSVKMFCDEDDVQINDSQDYVPSQDYSVGLNSIQESEKFMKKAKAKKKSSNYFSQRLSAIASQKMRESERLSSSILNNSVYIDNGTEYGHDGYSCIPCLKPSKKQYMPKSVNNPKPSDRSKRRFDANKSVDCRISEIDAGSIKKSRYRSKSRIKDKKPIDISSSFLSSLYCCNKIFK